MCIILISIIFQNLYKFFIISNNWQNHLLFKLLIFSLALNGILLCFLFKKYIVRYLSSPRLNLTLLIMLGISLILRHFIPQGDSFNLYNYNLSEIQSVLFLNNIFRSWWFTSILFLLFLSSVITIFIRGKYQRNRIAFYLIHFGVSFVLIGIFIFYSQGWKGELILNSDKEENEIRIISGNKKEKNYQLNYKIKLLDYKIDYYPEEWRLNLYQRNDRTGDYKIISSIDPHERKTFIIPGTNWKYHIVNYYPEFRAEKKVVKLSTNEPVNPALKIRIISDKEEKEEWLLAKEKNTYLDEEDKFQVTFIWQWNKEIQKRLTFRGESEKHFLRINIRNREKIISVQVGKKYRWRNFSFSILKFLPHFRYDLKTKSPYSVSDKPENPALLIKVEKIFPKEKGILIWLFSRLHRFESTSLFNNELKLEYSYVRPKIGVNQHIVITGEDKTIRFIQRRSFFIIPFEFGIRYRINKKDIQILEMHPAVDTKIEFMSVSDLPKNPAIYLVLGSPRREIPFLKEKGDEPIVLEGGKYILNFENDRKVIKNIKSNLKIRFSNGVEKRYWIDRNHPVKIGKIYFLQDKIFESEKIMSKIHVFYKPGIEIFYTGFLLCLIGLLIQLFGRREGEEK
ncbi:cytochrome c biogenesis protein ResB [Candidatus Aminicenantes bacterium AC-335-A11]|nr:cytochrome c biogenesis protein ResB [SCandidatus Aminicenantes bacterium Aminicenantia_JdfR_composite]MCP2617914.1 cytochrome c biogenesis protein ResB [Candidatus Aminicenantes bacterium AC-335-A11]